MKGKWLTVIMGLALALSLVVGLPAKPASAGTAPEAQTIAVRGSPTTATNTSTTLAISKPTGVVAGDIMIANITKIGNDTTDPTCTGWTLIDSADLGGTTLRMGAVLYRIADGTEGSSFTFALGTGTYSAAGGIVAFSGVNTSTPFDVTPGAIYVSASSTTVTASGITTASANAAVIMFGQADSSPTWSGWNTTSPGSLTELFEARQTYSSAAAAWATKTAAGATGNGTATLSFSSRNGGILIALKPGPSTVTVGNGTPEPSNTTIGPGGSATMLDAFTLQTAAGTDTVTGATVTLAPAGAYNNIALVELTPDAGGTAYCSASPTGDAVAIASCSIAVTTTSTQYKVRITPKTHANMPVVPGASYATTGRVTAITSTGNKTYNDGGSATVTVDNLSPGNPTTFSGTSAPTQMTLNWTNPTDTDLSQLVVVRRIGQATDATQPTEGTTYTAGNAIGTGTVACVVSSPATTCTDSGLTNGTSYYYRIFAKDSNGNYSNGGATAGPVTPNKYNTTTGVSCTPSTVTYGGSTSCTATVTRSAGSATPGGTVAWGTSGSGTFTTSPCTLSGSGGTATCSVTYTPSAVGTNPHTLTATYNGDTNFNTSSGTANVTVNPKALTITANSRSKTYGDAVTFAGTEFTTSGLVFGDAVTSVTLTSGGAAATATVGGSPYQIVPSAASGTGLSNYNISYTNGTLTVNPLAVVLTGARDYDTTNTVSSAILSVSNKVGSDVVTVASGSGTLASANAGSQAITNFGTLTLGGAAASNYTLTGASGTVTINKATPTATLVVAAPTRVCFTGSAQAATVNVSASSVPGGASNVKYNGSGTVPSAAATYAVAADFVPTDSSNYKTLTGLPAGSFTISNGIPVSSVTSGLWSDPATWGGSLPLSCDSRVVANGDVVTVNTSTAVANGLTVNSGGTLALSAGMNFGAGLTTINGTLRIDSSSVQILTYGPIYGAGSLLQYNTGGDAHRTYEWLPGGSTCPANVQISNNTTLYYGFGDCPLSGNLTIDAGSTLDTGSNANSMTVAGSVTFAGTLLLADYSNGDLHVNVGGNWINNGGTFTPNGRTVVLNGTAAQTIGGSSPTAFDYLILNNAAGASLATDATVNNTLTLTAGLFNIVGRTLDIGPSGSISASDTSFVVTDTTGVSAASIAAAETSHICKKFTGTGSFTFEVGDNFGTPEHSPATLDFTSGTFDANARACVDVTNAMLNNDTSLYPQYIKRQWNVTTSGITGFSCSVSFTYVDADLVAGGQAETSLGLWKVDGGVFALVPDTAVSTSANTLSGTATLFSDFTGRSMTPLAVDLADFRGEAVGGQAVLTWETVSEQDNAGFNVYRGATEQGPWAKANDALIPSAVPGSSEGHAYKWTDANPLPGVNWYLLEDVDVHGATARHGPVQVGLDAPTAVTIQHFGAQRDWVSLLRQLFGK